MRTQKLQGTDAFVVFDLDDAARSIGITRLAPKILMDGAALLARTNSYLFATFEQKVGGASAGINAKPEDRAAAIAAFVAEVQPLVSEGTFLTGPGKGLGESDLAPLLAVDPRSPISAADAGSLLGTSVAVSADKALGGLDGATVAIEGLDAASLGVVAALVERGAKVIAAGTATGTISNDAGLDVAALTSAITEHGAAGIEQLGIEAAPAWKVLTTSADILCVGSKSGVIHHDNAGTVAAKVVVPVAPVPVSAKALAMLRRSGTIVLPDFVTIAGPMFASFPDQTATADELRGIVAERVTAVLDEVLGHDDGPLLGACLRAEAFLETWRDTLPFGRPIA